MTRWIAVALVTLGCGGAPGADSPPPEPGAAVDVQGHRGARGLRPENTLPAFELAMDLEVTTLEMDVHLTADDVVVVWHDPTLTADKCAGPGIDDAPAVRALTFAQFREYRCDRNPEPARFPEQRSEPSPLAGDAYHIAKLTDVLDLAEAYANAPTKTASARRNAGRIRFNVETKRVLEHPEYIGDGFDGTEPGKLEARIVQIVRDRKLLDRFVLQSFDHRSLWAARTIEPNLRLAALTDDDIDIETYARRGADIWSPNHQKISAALVSRARAAGLLVIPWTVNDRAALRRLLEWGVDGIISDRPDIVVDELSRAR